MKEAIKLFEMGVITESERNEILNEERIKLGYPPLESFLFQKKS